MDDDGTGLRLRAVVLTIVAFTLIGGVVGFGLGRATAPGDRVEPLPRVRPPSMLGVPDLEGQSLEEARERLTGLDFAVGFRQPPSGEGTGEVGSQVPPAGEIVERGSLVVVIEGRIDGPESTSE